MDVPKLGIELELLILATATDPSCICDLYHSSWEHQILNPRIEAQDRTCILMGTSQARFR